MKKFEILWEVPECDTETGSAIGKMVPVDLLSAGLPQTFNLWKMQYLWSAIKCNKVKHNKTSYACIAF